MLILQAVQVSDDLLSSNGTMPALCLNFLNRKGWVGLRVVQTVEFMRIAVHLYTEGRGENAKVGHDIVAILAMSRI